jgi:pimeloyl-ACP methyl ester carboxylesterase
MIHGINGLGKTFNNYIDCFSVNYHIILPILDGFDPEHPSTYISAEEEASTIAEYLKNNTIHSVYMVLGISIGGTVAFEMVYQNKIAIKYAVIDGASLSPRNRFFGLFSPKTPSNIRKKMTKESYKNVLTECNTYSTFTDFDAAETKMLFIYGSREMQFGNGRSVKTLRYLPGANINIIDGYGHCGFLSETKRYLEEIDFMFNTNLASENKK